MTCERELSEQQARDLAGAFLFTGDEQEKEMGMLSGGERARVRRALPSGGGRLYPKHKYETGRWPGGPAGCPPDTRPDVPATPNSMTACGPAEPIRKTHPYAI